MPVVPGVIRGSDDGGGRGSWKVVGGHAPPQLRLSIRTRAIRTPINVPVARASRRRRVWRRVSLQADDPGEICRLLSRSARAARPISTVGRLAGTGGVGVRACVSSSRATRLRVHPSPCQMPCQDNSPHVQAQHPLHRRFLGASCADAIMTTQWRCVVHRASGDALSPSGRAVISHACHPYRPHTMSALLAVALSSLSLVSAAPLQELEARQFSSSSDSSFGPPKTITTVIVVVAVIVGIGVIGGLIWKFVRPPLQQYANGSGRATKPPPLPTATRTCTRTRSTTCTPTAIMPGTTPRTGM